MALTTARKKANAKYEAKAYDKTLIRLPKGRLDEIRAHIGPSAESLNGFIGRAITETMERDSGGIPSTSSQEAAREALPPDTLKVAQRASEASGETLPDFVRRAVERQAKQDEVARCGMNTASGKE